MTKNGDIAQFESSAERIHLLTLDRNPRVVRYQTQPELLEYRDQDGKLRHYTPDVKVWMDDGCIELHEVTVSERRIRTAGRRRELAALEICRARGWRYVVITEHELPQGAHRANLMSLFRYRPTVYGDEQVMNAAWRLIKEKGPVIISVLAQQVSQSVGRPKPTVMGTIYHMVWHGYIQTDLSQLIFGQDWHAANPTVWLLPEN